MIKAFIFTVIAVASVFAGSNTVTTKYRTDLDLTTGTAVTSEYVSTFELMPGRFSHSAPGITSIYVVKEGTTANALDLNGNNMLEVAVRSEVGNEYLYVFDWANKRIYTIFSNGTRMVQFDIDEINVTE